MATNGSFISNLFRPTQQVTQAPQAPQAPAPQPASNAPGSSMEQGGAPKPPDSPLDPFKDLWKNDPQSGGNQPPSDPFSAPLFSTDPEKIKQAAGQMDFISQVNPELVQKAMSGQDPQAFLQVMNSVAQSALATALQVGAGTVEQAGTKLGQRFNQAMPGKFRDLQINAAAPANPVLSHPAAAPFLNMAKNQIKMMNPDFTPQQVNAEAEKYMVSFASSLSKPIDDPTARPPGSEGETDWDNWVNSSSNT